MALGPGDAMPHDDLMSDLERVLRELARLTERLQNVKSADGEQSDDIAASGDDLRAVAAPLTDADDLPGRRAS
jgi:hypothetical protein